MSNQNDQRAEDETNRRAFVAVCAKIGTPKAAEASASGTYTELHNSRKEVRRMVNKITAESAEREQTPEEVRALHHAMVLMSRIDSTLDLVDERKSTQAAGLKVMRSQADFEKAYLGNGPSDMTVADFFRGVANLNPTERVRNALSEGTNTTGGFTVPNELMPAILGALSPNSSLMQAGMGIVSLEGGPGAKTFTTAIVDAIPTAGWRLENGNVVESEPTFRGVVAAPKSLAFLFKISRELLADSANIDAALIQAIGQSFASALDLAGLRGSGAGPIPLGLKNTAGIQTVDNGVDGALLDGYSNLFSAAQDILQADAPMPTAAIMSPRSLVRLGGLLDSTGQPLLIPPMLQGVKQISSSQIPNNLVVGASADCSEIYVGDFTKMLMMLREGVSVQRVDQLYAATGQIGFVCHVRADFSVMYPSAFALVSGVR